MGGRRARGEPESVHQGRQHHCPLALILFAHPAGVMTEGPGAAGALVAVDFHLAQSVIAHVLGGAARWTPRSSGTPWGPWVGEWLTGGIVRLIFMGAALLVA